MQGDFEGLPGSTRCRTRWKRAELPKTAVGKLSKKEAVRRSGWRVAEVTLRADRVVHTPQPKGRQPHEENSDGQLARCSSSPLSAQKGETVRIAFIDLALGRIRQRRARKRTKDTDNFLSR
jgi:hypothetical protein